MTENKKLSMKMRKSYLKSPLRCPWCRSGDIEAPASPEVDSGTATQLLKCNQCGKRWIDIYRLVNMREEL